MENEQLTTETNTVEEMKPVTLPTAYVMWLTMRSKFIDALAEKNVEIYHQWKEFEDNEMSQIERMPE